MKIRGTRISRGWTVIYSVLALLLSGCASDPYVLYKGDDYAHLSASHGSNALASFFTVDDEQVPKFGTRKFKVSPGRHTVEFYLQPLGQDMTQHVSTPKYYLQPYKVYIDVDAGYNYEFTPTENTDEVAGEPGFTITNTSLGKLHSFQFCGGDRRSDSFMNEWNRMYLGGYNPRQVDDCDDPMESKHD